MVILRFTILLLIFSQSNRGADLNVGTTLFTKADRCKECWSSESIALLTSRMILEDLLPSTSILVIDSNEFVTDLVEYFRLILETVRQETHGKTKHIVLMALADLLGGYLYHAVLPIAKYAFYAGLIDYDSMTTLLGLFDELKWFLRTNGQGWSKPLSQNLENFEIQRIPLQPCNDKGICENLMLVEAESGGSNAKSDRCDVTIPLPFFDSLTRPSAIALPTKTCPLHNLEANSSSYLIMKFFVNSYKCLQSKNTKIQNLEKFQNEFCGWIEDQIMPRLEDEKFYAAFGGILRVRNTLKRLGISQNNLNKQISDFQQAADNMIASESNTNLNAHQMSRSSMVLMAVLITIFVWFILGTMFICYRMRNSKQKDECDKDCHGPEDCPDKMTQSSSLGSSKYFYPERLKTKDSKGTSSAETDSGSDLDVTSLTRNKKKYPVDSLHYHKINLERGSGRGARHEINIRTCHCHDEEDDDDDDDDSVTGVGDSNQTEGRLPSITEISELTTSDSRPSGKRTPGTTGGTSTPKSNKSDRRNRVQKQVYEDLDETTEDTSEPS